MNIDTRDRESAVELRKRELIRSALKDQHRLATSSPNADFTPENERAAGKHSVTQGSHQGEQDAGQVAGDIFKLRRMYWTLLAAVVFFAATLHITLQSLRISLDSLVRDSVPPATLPLDAAAIRNIVKTSVQEELFLQSGKSIPAVIAPAIQKNAGGGFPAER